jgi:hypothetical protein
MHSLAAFSFGTVLVMVAIWAFSDTLIEESHAARNLDIKANAVVFPAS